MSLLLILLISLKDLEEGKSVEAEDTTENDISDPEEDYVTDSQQTNKLSELYCTTIPSVDSAMESWDGSGLDAGYGSQGGLSDKTSRSENFHRFPPETALRVI